MALKKSGSLRFSQIEQEFGQTSSRKFGGYRISKNIGDMSEIPLDEGIGQEKDDGTASSIRFSQFRGSRLNVIVHYANDHINERARGGNYEYNNGDSVIAISPDPDINPRIKAPNGKGAKVILHVSSTLLSNKEPGSQSGSHLERCALRSGNPEYWDKSAILHINIGHEAVVSGSGGDGGAGGDPDRNGGRGEDGENGSSAIGIATKVDKIIIQEGAVVQAGGGGGGGGGAAKNDKKKLSGPSGGGGSGLPAGGAAPPPAPTAAGAVLDFKMRWSSRFLNKSGGVHSIPSTPGSAGNSPDGAFMDGTVAYREATMNWNSGSSPIVDNNVSMVKNGDSGTFQVKIRYSPHQIPGEGGQITNFQIRWSGTFVDNTGSSPVKDPSGGNPTGSGTGAWFDWANNSNNNYGLRDGIMNWSNDLTPINETVTMIGGNGDNFRVNITYEPYIPVPNSSNFTTKIIINSIVNSGKDYSQNDVLSTSTWNNSEPGSDPAPRIIQVTGVTEADYHTKVEILEVKNTGKDYSEGDVLSTTKWNNTATNGGISANPRILQVTEVSSSFGGNEGGLGSTEGKQAGDGGDGDFKDTGSGGGITSGGGGGGGSPYGGNFVGEGGAAGFNSDPEADNNATDGGDGSAGKLGKGGDGGDAAAEGGDQVTGNGGDGGQNGFGLVLKNGLDVDDMTIVRRDLIIGEILNKGSSDIQI